MMRTRNISKSIGNVASFSHVGYYLREYVMLKVESGNEITMITTDEEFKWLEKVRFCKFKDEGPKVVRR